MPMEQFNKAPSPERRETYFNSGDRLDLHMSSEHVAPYKPDELPKKREQYAPETINATPEKPQTPEVQVAAIGVAVLAMRKAVLERTA